MQATKRRLGRGLAALIGEDASEDSVVQDAPSLRHVPVELLHASANNPRRDFGEEEIEELARSIREKGVLQPIVIRPRGDGEYEIVAGERRWRAAQRAGLHDIPAIIRTLTDGQALEIALIENVQRADLNAIEEAQGYALLTEKFSYTQQQLADAVGKSRSHVANMMRLLNLPQAVRQYLIDGTLTAGHARALAASDRPEELALMIVKHGMNVRQAEDLARRKPPEVKQATEKSADTRALERQLTEALGLKVDIADGGKGAGAILIRYKSLEQLDEVAARLSRPA